MKDKIESVQLTTKKCNRCNHLWLSSITPKACPYCKSYNYNKIKTKRKN